MKKLSLLAAVLASATFLACCGGSGDASQVAAADAQIAVDGSNGKRTFTAMANESFLFTNGVADFGTAAATTVSITPPATAGTNPTFNIAAGGDTASGTMAFGSCKFQITASTFDAPSPLLVGETITIENCDVKLDTSGQGADGVAVDVSAVLVLNNASSTNTTVTVAINENGKITLNGTVVGTVTLRPVTGAF
jgi:hypothetical protein